MSKRRILSMIMFITLAAISLTAICPTVWGQTSHQVEVRRGTVVYVSGNDLVVKTEDGKIKHYVIPSDQKFNLDGKEATISDLRPGTKLTQTITTTTEDHTVTSVRNIDAKVWQVNAPYLVLTLADGTNKQVKVPDGTVFTVDGEKKTVFDLRPGMNLSGTIVTATPETVVSKKTEVTGKAPKPVDTPAFVGVLLIEEEDSSAGR